MNEIWKEVKNYEGKYLVSNKGRVRSLERKASDGRRVREKMLKQTLGKCPYISSMLVGNGKNKRIYIHRLVAEAFLEEKPGRLIVNHLDGNKLNNNVNNLEWCTTKENNAHAIDNGLAVKVKHPLQASNEYGYGLFFPSVYSAKSHGFTRGLIWAVLNKKQKKHKGFKWDSLKH